MNQCKNYAVREFMRTDVITAKDSNTLGEIIEMMLREKTNAMVVTNPDNTIAGIVTSWGLIEHLVPDYLEEDKHLAAFEADSVFCERVMWMRDQKVSEIMSTNVHTVNPDDSLMEVSTQISQHHIRQLPVVDENNKLVGYINHTDIKRAMGMALGCDKQLIS